MTVAKFSYRRGEPWFCSVLDYGPLARPDYVTTHCTQKYRNPVSRCVLRSLPRRSLIPP